MEYTNSMMRSLIEEHIHSLRDRELCLRRLIDGLTFEQLAYEFQLSPRQTRTIIHRCEVILFQHCR